MQLSRFADYALRTLMYLACNPQDTVAVGDISQAYGISFHHLSKVTQALAKAGWVEVHRGRSGGLRLVVAPEELKISDVIHRMEPSLDLVECFSAERNQCRIVPVCRLRGALERAREAFFAELARTTLADLVEPRLELVQLFHPSSPSLGSQGESP